MKDVVNFLSLKTFFLVFMLTSCNKQNLKIKLKTNIDSIAYAQGALLATQANQIFTQLELKSQNKIDFIKGFENGLQIDIKNKKESAFTVGKMLGYQIGTQFIPFLNKQLFYTDSTKTINKDILLSGYISVINDNGSTLLSKDEIQKYSKNTMLEKIRGTIIEKQYKNFKKENLDFLEKNKSNKRVIVLPSGLQYKIIKKGNGPKPKANDLIEMDYCIMNIKKEILDSSVKNTKSIKFSLHELIKGLLEGIQLMPVGSKYIFYIPYYLAYGKEIKKNNLPPYSTIIFEAELHKIVTKNNGKN
ncbi:MAG: FKBP-type peptidyl-prolyl cis-trans isomerase [Bacteroidales bacterium OttesenSCG-928-I14]|jgi:FKBP-type peptidyl-prolyl cis-trans isomerase FklB|nr:FKBP-type peptidyl-prolyl cis-trans isomerase [Bacteroidales bacterium OttesenSCG-928-I14]